MLVVGGLTTSEYEGETYIEGTFSVDVWFVPGLTADEVASPFFDPAPYLDDAPLASTWFVDGSGNPVRLTAPGDGAFYLSLSSDAELFEPLDYALVFDRVGEATGSVSPPPRVGTELGGVADPFAPGPTDAARSPLLIGDGAASSTDGAIRYAADFEAGKGYVVSVVGIGTQALLSPSVSRSGDLATQAAGGGYSGGPTAAQSWLFPEVDVSGSGFSDVSVRDAVVSFPSTDRGRTGGDFRISILEARELEPFGDVAGQSFEGAQLLRIGEALSASLNAAGDVDRFEIVAPDGAGVLVGLVPFGVDEATSVAQAGDALIGGRMTFIAVNERTGAARELGVLGGFRDIADESSALVQARAGERLYVDISHPSRTGDYMLSAVQQFDTVGGDLATQGGLAVGDAVFGLLLGTQDEDWYAASLSAGVEYAFAVADDPALPRGGVNIDLTLRDADGAALSFAEGGETGGTLSFTPTESGTYFLALAKDPEDDAFTGSQPYQVSHTSLSPPPAQTVSRIEAFGGETTEGTEDGEGGRLAFSLRRSGDLSVETTVDYIIEPGTAGADDVVGTLPREGSVTFAAGETVKPVIVDVTPDARAEIDETLTLRFTGADGPGDVEILRETAEGVIRDDEPAPILFIETLSNGDEGGGRRPSSFGQTSAFWPSFVGNGEGRPAEFVIKREGPAEEGLVVDYAFEVGDPIGRVAQSQEWTTFGWSVWDRWFSGPTTDFFVEDTVTLFNAATDPTVNRSALSGQLALGGDEAVPLEDLFGLPDLSFADEFTLFEFSQSAPLPSALLGGTADISASASLAYSFPGVEFGALEIAGGFSSRTTTSSFAVAGEDFVVSVDPNPAINLLFEVSGAGLLDFEVDLDLSASAALRDVSVGGVDFGDLELTASDGLGFDLLPSSLEGEIAPGVTGFIKTPEGALAQAGRSVRSGETATGTTSERSAGAASSGLETLSAVVPAFDLLKGEETLETGVGARSFEYVLADLFLSLGYDLVTEIAFTPELETSLRVDGTRYDLTNGQATISAGSAGVLDGVVD